MQHENWCDLGSHRPPLDEISRIVTPCTGKLIAVGSIAAWLTKSNGHTMVDLDYTPGVSIVVQEFAEFCQRGLVMALRGGAVLLGPATA